MDYSRPFFDNDSGDLWEFDHSGFPSLFYSSLCSNFPSFGWFIYGLEMGLGELLKNQLAFYGRGHGSCS